MTGYSLTEEQLQALKGVSDEMKTIVGEGLPTSATQAEVGQSYFDKISQKTYTAVSDEEGLTWVENESSPIKNYGTVTYYSEWEEGYLPKDEDSCTVSVTDADLLKAWVEAHPSEMPEEDQLDFDYMGDHWEVRVGWESIQIEDFAELGLSVELDEGATYARFTIEYQVQVNLESEKATVDILGDTQWESLGTGSLYPGADRHTAPLGTEGVVLSVHAIYMVKIDCNQVTYFPKYFLAGCQELVELRNTQESDYYNINFYPIRMDIPDGFLYSCPKFNQANLFFQNLNKIGSSCFSVWPSYTGSISISIGNYGDDEATIGDDCFWYLTKVSGQVFIQSAQSVGRYFLANLAQDATEPVGQVYVKFKEDATIGDSMLADAKITKLGLGGSGNNTVPAVKIGYSFLSNATIADWGNSALNFPKLKDAGSSFLYSVSISVPISFPVLETTQNSFLEKITFSAGSSLNLEFPKIESLGDRFLNDASNIGSIDFQDASTNILPTSKQYFLTNTGGVEIRGTYAREIVSALPNRNLTVGTTSSTVIGELRSLITSGSSAPTTSTSGNLGQLYINTADGTLYHLTGINGSTYTWTQIS